MDNVKKLIFILAVFALCVTLISCGSEKGQGVNETTDNDVVETNDLVEIKEEEKQPILPEGIAPAKYVKFVQFEAAEGDFRKIVVDHMRTQANIKWVASNNITIKEDLNTWNIDLVYERGKTYHGLPYTNLMSSYHQFADEVNDNNGKFGANADSWESIVGVQCCSSIMNAIQQVTNKVYGETANLIPNGKATCRAIKLGEYRVADDCAQTNEIVDANDPQTMYKAYALLNVGDIVVKRVNGAPHIRVVTEKATVVNANGKVNAGRSYIKCVEQTNAFDETRTDGVFTTWREDKMYIFTDLFEGKYIPVTLEVYETKETEIPYLALDEETTESVLAKKMISGTVSSNYPLRFVYVDIYNEIGVKVEHKVIGGMHSVFKVNLRKECTGLFDKLTAGKYTLVVEAGISKGSAELSRVEFNVQ